MMLECARRVAAEGGVARVGADAGGEDAGGGVHAGAAAAAHELGPEGVPEPPDVRVKEGLRLRGALLQSALLVEAQSPARLSGRAWAGPHVHGVAEETAIAW